MNTRSLKFQLIVWYAGALIVAFALLGGAAYVMLDGYLVAALKQSQLSRARQIAQLIIEESRHSDGGRVGEEIEARYSPSLNDRLVRVTRDDGRKIYASGPPKNQGFVPANLPRPAWIGNSKKPLKTPVGGGREILIVTLPVEAGGKRYLIESGALLNDVQDDLHQWLMFLTVALPVAAAVAVGGGFLLVKRALSPVDEISASAERISSHNLSERLPVAQTGDELQRLSTALNRMIERLDEAFQYSRRFVADASHELRTPLTVLRGELEGCAQEQQLTIEWRDRLGSALEEVERLVDIVEGLFAISRLDAGEAQAELVRFDLGKLTAATADQMALLAEDKRIQINCSSAQEVWVEGDRARMKQVVVNLLDNAIKYTAEGGEVGLKVAAHEKMAVLEVTDNGMGIPPEALPRVFERFFRVDTARSRERGGGAGLGLSIVKSICAAHNGRVTASSESGRGSCFRVELPLAASSAINGNKIHAH